jgi:nitrite reductase (NO-forming)
LFLVGALLLAISGASRLFTITWSAAPPVTGGRIVAQRWLLAVGASGLAAGRELEWPVAILAAAGLCVTAGLLLLVSLLVTETRTAKVRRFRPAVAYYVTALVFGIIGTALGAALVTGRADIRDPHVIVNLLGLVGLVIAGTLPFFVATQVRMKMHRRATPRQLHANLAWLATSTAVSAVAAYQEVNVVEGAALIAYAAGLVHIALLLPHPGAKQLAWAGPRLVQLGAGVAWWAGAVVVGAQHAFAGHDVFSEQLVVTLVVGGYVQILIASLAYLAPVLRGGGHVQLSAAFATTRSWVALAAANGAGAAWVSGYPRVTCLALAVLAIDVVWRSGRLMVDAMPAFRPRTDRSVARV